MLRIDGETRINMLNEALKCLDPEVVKVVLSAAARNLKKSGVLTGLSQEETQGEFERTKAQVIFGLFEMASNLATLLRYNPLGGENGNGNGHHHNGPISVDVLEPEA